MVKNRSLLKQIRGWLLLASFICASAGALGAIRFDKPNLGIYLLMAAALGLAATIVVTVVAMLTGDGRARSFNPRMRHRTIHRKRRSL